MIEIRLAIDQDQPDWDSYVSEHPDASPYHLQAWIKTVEAAYGHRGFCLMAHKEEQVVGILPIILMRPPLLLPAKLISLPFCDVGGCLSDSTEIKTALMDSAFSQASKNGVKTLEIRATGNCEQTVGQPCGDDQGKKMRMVMPLPESSNILWNGFKSKLRSQVRKAEKNGLTYSIGQDNEYINEFYLVFSQNMRNLGSPVHSRSFFKSLMKHYAKNMFVSLVKLEDKVVGAGLVLVLDKIATIPWASTVLEYNKYAPNMLLYWSILKHVTDNGCSRFDFGRSTYNEGTYKFKQQWGAQPLPLEWLSYNSSGALLDVDTNSGRLRFIVEKIWQKLPLFITNSLGPLVRKHISL